MISHNNVHVWRGCKVSQRGTEIGIQSLFERLSYPLLIITTSNIQNLSLKVGEIVSTSSFHPSNFEITLGSEIESIHSGFDYPRVSMILVWHVRELVCLFVCLLCILNFFLVAHPRSLSMLTLGLRNSGNFVHKLQNSLSRQVTQSLIQRVIYETF